LAGLESKNAGYRYLLGVQIDLVALLPVTPERTSTEAFAIL
jgi:hypothetical protein